jgi:hypothetical protein
MAKPALDSPGVVPLVGERVAGVRSMCGCALSSSPATAAARSIIRAKPAVVNGEPRSLTKTKGEDGLYRTPYGGGHGWRLGRLTVPMREVDMKACIVSSICSQMAPGLLA